MNVNCAGWGSGEIGAVGCPWRFDVGMRRKSAMRWIDGALNGHIPVKPPGTANDADLAAALPSRS
jgi:hypothetical protein